MLYSLARGQDFHKDGAPAIKLTQFIVKIITRGSQFRLHLVWGHFDLKKMVFSFFFFFFFYKIDPSFSRVREQNLWKVPEHSSCLKLPL